MEILYMLEDLYVNRFGKFKTIASWYEQDPLGLS